MKEKLLENRKVLWSVTIIVLLISTAEFIYVVNMRPLEIKDLEVEFLVSNRSGIDLNQEKLAFGYVLPGGSVTRRFVIENKKDISIKSEVVESESLYGYLSFERSFILIPGERKEVFVTLYTPKDAKEGFYSGKLTIFNYKA